MNVLQVKNQNFIASRFKPNKGITDPPTKPKPKRNFQSKDVPFTPLRSIRKGQLLTSQRRSAAHDYLRVIKFNKELIRQTKI